MPGQIDLNATDTHLEGQIMSKEPRWLKSAIAASSEMQVVMPFHRQNRSRPAAMKAVVAKPAVISAIAAR